MNIKTTAMVAATAYSVLAGGSADGGYVGLDAELHAAPVIDGAVWTVWRVYAMVDNPADTIEAISGNAANPIIITTDLGDLYQHPLGGLVEHPASLEIANPDLAYDSYVTIGSVDAESHPPTQVSGDLGFEPSALHASNGAWFRIPGDPATVAGPDGRVIIGQFTVRAGARLDGIVRVAGNFDFDSQQFLEQTFAARFGDATDDGHVDQDDVMMVIGNWGPCEESCPADVNADEKVDVDDLIVVLIFWDPG